MHPLAPAAAVILTACAGTTAYVASHQPVRVVDKPVTVEKTVYVLSPDGKTGTPQDATSPPGKTGVKDISPWTDMGDKNNYEQGFKVVEVDGQRCILWIRLTQPEFNGSQTGSGMSCRPIEAK